MDDMTAFDRQIAGEVLLGAGPSEPVDDLAIFDAVIAANRHKGWGFTMFSALKFVAASVIVALFGGFLLAGLFTTQQSDEVLTAASASPTVEATREPTETQTTSVRTDILPGVALNVEEVEPGVFHVLDDGVRELHSGRQTDIVAGHDDGIWLLRKNQFFRLGSDAGHAWPDAVGPQRVFFEVTPDGTVWVIQAEDPGYGYERGTLLSSDGDGWTDRQSPPGVAFAIEVAPDGTLWASWDAVDDRTVGSLGPSGWEPLPLPPWGREDAYRLYVTDSGVLYTQRCVYGFCVARRYEDGAWRQLEDSFKFIAVAPDGTIWQLDAGGERLVRRIAADEWPSSSSLEFLQANGLGPIALEGIDMDFPTSIFTAAPDASLWTSLWQEAKAEGRGDPQCDGLVRFDGATMTADRFLPGRCVTIDIAADGSVWVLADEEVGKGLYVITPEAVAATE